MVSFRLLVLVTVATSISSVVAAPIPANSDVGSSVPLVGDLDELLEKRGVPISKPHPKPKPKPRSDDLDELLEKRGVPISKPHPKPKPKPRSNDLDELLEKRGVPISKPHPKPKPKPRSDDLDELLEKRGKALSKLKSKQAAAPPKTAKGTPRPTPPPPRATAIRKPTATSTPTGAPPGKANDPPRRSGRSVEHLDELLEKRGVPISKPHPKPKRSNDLDEEDEE